MKKLKVEYFPAKCIGNGSCTVASPEFFHLKGKKAILQGASLNGSDVQVLEQEFHYPDDIIEAGRACPANAIRITDLDTGKVIVSSDVEKSSHQQIKAIYNDAREFVLDKEGYFLIRTNEKTKEIEVGFCNDKNNVVLTVAGTKPIDIYHTIINKVGLNIRKDHCAYLGRELQKAYIALQLKIKYVQDEELVF